MMNRTMRLLLLSDIFVLTGFGLIQPILAIYINDGVVTGGTMLTAGLVERLLPTGLRGSAGHGRRSGSF